MHNFHKQNKALIYKYLHFRAVGLRLCPRHCDRKYHWKSFSAKPPLITWSPFRWESIIRHFRFSAHTVWRVCGDAYHVRAWKIRLIWYILCLSLWTSPCRRLLSLRFRNLSHQRSRVISPTLLYIVSWKALMTCAFLNNKTCLPLETKRKVHSVTPLVSDQGYGNALQSDKQ